MITDVLALSKRNYFVILVAMNLHQIVQETGSWFATHGWRIIAILGVCSLVRRFGVAFISRFINHNIEASGRFENERDRKLRANTLVGLVDSVLKITTYAIATLLILSELNVLRLVAPLLAGAGVLTLLVGFGIQTFVKDFISGIFIVAENQYRVGDVVSLSSSVGGSVEGTVVRISLRTTVIRDNDGAIHFIPNGNIVRAANQTLDYAKVNIELTLPISADFDAAEQAIGALGLTMGKEELWEHTIVQAPYYHGVQTFDNDHVTVEVRAKTIPAEQWRVSSELQKRLAKLISDNDFFTEPKKLSKT